MSSGPLVSVIMIFFNAEKFMDEAIQSLFDQTYQNWQLILIDDGSKDRSTEIAKEYVRRSTDRVHYFNHPGGENRGMSASRNLGIREARGDYIAFLDADDLYLPQKLERQVAILNNEPEAGMVYGATMHWYSWTGTAEDSARDAPRKLGVPTNVLIKPPRLVILFLRHQAWTPGTCGVLIRRKTIEEIGGFEESFKGMLEDQVFFYKLCLHASVYVESGSWDRYRQHSQSSVQSAIRTAEYHPREPNPSHRTFLFWLKGYLDKKGINHMELRRALNSKLWPYRHPGLYWLSRPLSVVQSLPMLVGHRWSRALRKRFHRLIHPAWLGTIRRTTPLSNRWGYDRGTPVDRYYIERFLQGHRADIKGRVLEIKDRTYTLRYGSAVKQSEILDIDPTNEQATIIADLAAADSIPADCFDCVIITQTLHLIFETRAAVYHAHRILRPGGILLVTVPAVSRIIPGEGSKSDYWRFTAASCSALFREFFLAENLRIESHGNVLSSVAFLTGMAWEELSRRELDDDDAYFPLIITVRGVKPS